MVITELLHLDIPRRSDKDALYGKTYTSHRFS